jgi:Domain of unknown function (DUF5666)
MPMLSNLIAAIAGFLLLGLQLPATPLAGPPLAAAVASQDTNFTLEGKITAITGDRLTVSTEENIIFHVRYSNTTEIKKPDGSPDAAKDLHVGLRIGVAGDLAESGEILAKKIEIQPEAPQKK